VMEYGGTVITQSDSFDFQQVNDLLQSLAGDCKAFVEGPARQALSWNLTFSATARYPRQVWSLDVPLGRQRFDSASDVNELVEAFHRLHEEVFAIADPGSPVEILGWRSRLACSLRSDRALPRCLWSGGPPTSKVRSVTFRGTGTVEVPVFHSESMIVGKRHEGPAIIESPYTTIVLDPGATAWTTDLGSVVITP